MYTICVRKAISVLFSCVFIKKVNKATVTPQIHIQENLNLCTASSLKQDGANSKVRWLGWDYKQGIYSNFPKPNQLQRKGQLVDCHILHQTQNRRTEHFWLVAGNSSSIHHFHSLTHDQNVASQWQYTLDFINISLFLIPPTPFPSWVLSPPS